MATRYELRTFADVVDAVMEELKYQSSDTVSEARIKRDINMVYLNEVVPYEQWKWLRGHTTLTQEARFATGTCAATEGQVAVTLTVSPATSRKGHWFSVDGTAELYRIAAHTANSTTVVLETPYVGATATAGTFKIWTDKLVLPTDCRDTVQVTADNLDVPLESTGIQKYRQYMASGPKLEGKPRWFCTSDYVDPDPYATVSGLPTLSTSASDGYVKTLVFGTSVSALFQPGDRIEITGASHYSFNGEFTVATVSTTTLTYTGRVAYVQAATADAGLTVKKLTTETDPERYKELWVYPSIYSTRCYLHVDYTKEAMVLVEDTDEPLMPIGDRMVLVYGALARAWARERNPEESARNMQMYERKLAKMAGKLDDGTDLPVLRPGKTWIAAKRQNWRQSAQRGRLAGWGGGSTSGGSSSPVNTANSAAIFDGAGELTASPTVSSTELSYLDGVLSQLAGNSDTATLTNKTISGSSNTLSNIAYVSLILTGSIVNADVSASAAIAYSKLNLVGAILDADISASAAIARAKIAAGTAGHVVINDGTTGLLSSEATLAKSRGGSGQDNSSLTFPASGTLATLAGTESFSNKTFSDGPTFTQIATPSTPGAGTQKFYPKSDGNFYTLTSAGLEVPVGSSTGGAKNYLTTYKGNTGNGNFELNSLTGWAEFNTTLTGVIPTGTISAGAASFTTSIESSGALAGNYSLYTDAIAAWAAGQGFISDAFTIDLEDKAKPMSFSFYYSITPIVAGQVNFSGTSSNTFAVYIYDVTNSAWIQPAGVYGITQGSGTGYCTGTFQTTSNSTQYRLAVLAVNASGVGGVAAYWDDFVVGPETRPLGAVVTDWQSYTSTTGLTGGTTTHTGYWRRVGDTMEVVIDALFTSIFTGGNATFTLPSGYSIDTSKIPGTPLGGAAPYLGEVGYYDVGSDVYAGRVYYSSATVVTCRITADDAGVGSLYLGTANSISTTAPFTWANGDRILVSFRAPIVGWSSNVQMSNDTDTRVVAARYTTTTAGSYSTGSATIIDFGTKDFDTHAAVTTGASWKYTAPVSGVYRVSSHVSWATNGTGSRRAELYKNGVFNQELHYNPTAASGDITTNTGTVIISLVAGDYIDLRGTQTSGGSLSLYTSSGYNHISIERLSGPSVIAATETVSCRYANTAGTTLTRAANNNVPFATKFWDTHGAWVTDTFTAPVTGKYLVTASITLATGATWASGDSFSAEISKNGVSGVGTSTFNQILFFGTYSGKPLVSVTGMVDCVAGDTIRIYANPNKAAAGNINMDTVTGNNSISIVRIGL